jgi:hypothetical protein
VTLTNSDAKILKPVSCIFAAEYEKNYK